MPAPVKYDKATVKQAYRIAQRDGTGMAGMDEYLGCARGTAYRLCWRYDLTPLKLPKERIRKASEADVRRAHKKAKSLTEAAAMCGMSRQGILYRFRELGLPTILRPSAQDRAAVVWEAYRGLMSATDVGKMVGLSHTAVSRTLWRVVHRMWGSKETSPALPKPTRLPLVKVYRELDEDPSLSADPDRLSELTGVRVDIIRAYLTRIRKG